VEDEQIIAEDLAGQVASLGHDVVGISISGEEAIAMAGQTKPELVLMDIQLEGEMTGTTAAQIIQQSVAAGIVFVSAFPRVLAHDTANLKEAPICLNKPFSRPQLEAVLRAAVASHASAQD
jgi:CheY-like chemotaxis protein